MIAAELLFKLLVGHAIADYALQGDTMAKYKRRSNHGGTAIGVPWYWWLGAHAFIHGGLVYVATATLSCACFEVIAHTLIDFGKCENRYGRHAMLIDQSLHVACKILYVAFCC